MKGDDTCQLKGLDHYTSIIKGYELGFGYHYSKLLKILNIYKPPPARLLDIGCATGGFLCHAMRSGYEITEIEPASGDAPNIPKSVVSSIVD